MITLITGGSGSGKSALAEDLVMSLAKEHMITNKYYLATMQVFGEEGRAKVARHKALRAGKGFQTIEQTTRIGACVEAMVGQEDGGSSKTMFTDNSKSIVLLECMSNLVANEMFAENGTIFPKEQVVQRILADMECIFSKATHVVIVSNEVFGDGEMYQSETMAYIEALGEVNRGLAERADRVYEAVVGILVPVK